MRPRRDTGCTDGAILLIALTLLHAPSGVDSATAIKERVLPGGGQRIGHSRADSILAAHTVAAFRAAAVTSAAAAPPRARAETVCPFDIPIVAITLPRSSIRRARLIASLQELGCEREGIHFVDAIDGSDAGALQRWSSISAGGRTCKKAAGAVPAYCCVSLPCRRRGDVELAVTLSHLRAARAALHLAAATSNDAVLVVEDDVDLSPAALWNTTLRRWLARVPVDWSFVQLGWTGYRHADWGFAATASHRGMVPRPGLMPIVGPGRGLNSEQGCAYSTPRFFGLFATVYSASALLRLMLHSVKVELPDLPMLGFTTRNHQPLPPFAALARTPQRRMSKLLRAWVGVGFANQSEPFQLSSTIFRSKGVQHYTVSESYLLNHALVNSARSQSWVAMPPLLLHQTSGRSVRLESVQPLNKRADVLARLSMASAAHAEQNSVAGLQRWQWMTSRLNNNVTHPIHRNSWRVGAQCAERYVQRPTVQDLRVSLDAAALCSPPTLEPPALAQEPSCAAEWAKSQLTKRIDRGATVVLLFRDTPFLQLRKWIEYHLLLGATTLIMVDNGCGELSRLSTERTLAPYIAHGIDVRHETSLRCQELVRDTIPRANATRDASTTIAGDVVMWLDDDELLVLPSDVNLTSLGHRMREQSVCAVRILWRVFGSGGHLCQPHSGHLAREFLFRSNVTHAWQATSGLKAQGKMAFIHPGGGGYACGGSGSGLHECVCKTTKCKASGTQHAKCAEYAPSQMWIAHYAFQSVAHWEAKKAQGSIQVVRKGANARSGNKWYDEQVLRSMARRVDNLLPKHDALHRCMRKVFDLQTSLNETLEIAWSAANARCAASELCRQHSRQRSGLPTNDGNSGVNRHGKASQRGRSARPDAAVALPGGGRTRRQGTRRWPWSPSARRSGAPPSRPPGHTRPRPSSTSPWSPPRRRRRGRSARRRPRRTRRRRCRDPRPRRSQRRRPRWTPSGAHPKPPRARPRRLPSRRQRRGGRPTRAPTRRRSWRARRRRRRRRKRRARRRRSAQPRPRRPPPPPPPSSTRPSTSSTRRDRS